MTTGRDEWPVAIVSMPFMDADRPSIQLGLLASIARQAGFAVETLHANLDFAALIGAERYRRLAAHRGVMVGDWLFSLEAFGASAPDPDSALPDAFTAELSYLGDFTEIRDHLLTIRHQEVPRYLDGLVDALDWQRFRVVAFSSTFQQNAASFALARRLKQRYPHLVTVFGGANFDGDMGAEFVRALPCIDLAVSGEADASFPQLLAALRDGTDPGKVPSVVRRLGDGQVAVTPAAAAQHRLDDSPVPDYEEYFQRAGRLGLLSRGARRQVWIPVETARGCWWGAKHHCLFCGLNATSMHFRAKSPDRVLDELIQQVRRCGSFRFAAVDNILDVGYLTTLFPSIIESGAGYQFFYEVKANLSRAQIRVLAQAGVTDIQPGIESLNSHVLRLMRKGATAAQNVNLLRWASYYDIRTAWNLLWGFPGETRHDYAEQSAVLPHLVHLQPPDADSRIWMERFSPLYTAAGDPAFGSRRPERSYRYVYPEHVDLAAAAYFFDYELAESLPQEAYDDVRAAVAAWRDRWQSSPRPTLTYQSAPHFLQIHDERWPGREGTYTFDGAAADVYTACSTRPMSADAVHDRLDRTVPVAAVREIFAEFTRLGLMFQDGRQGLALALPRVPAR